jgi:2-methylcitrate dehydratase PrpD
MSVLQAIVDFAASMRLAEVPSAVVDAGKRAVIDGVAVMLAGAKTDASRIVADWVREHGGRAEAVVLGHFFRAPAAAAALVNGTSGHALDYDDTQLSSAPDRVFGLLTHPTVPALAAALAVGERVDASGAALLEAFIAGVEVECKMADAIKPAHYLRGFHTSGTVGTFGALIAAAKLLGLDRTALAHGLGIAASVAAGIRANFGTMTKPLHVGRAAANGVAAAQLAARGFTASAEALDGPWGFFAVLGGGLDADRLLGHLGRPYTLVDPGLAIKPYPCGSLGHPSMDAMLKLVVEHDLAPERIRRIRLRAGSNILGPLRYRRATTALEAKFCPAFMLAAIVLRRRAGLDEFTDEFVRSEPVQHLMDKVETVLDPDLEALGFDRMRSLVEVELDDGRWVRQEAGPYRGGPERPFTIEELRVKFAECAARVLPPDRVDRAFAALSGLEQVDRVRRVVGELCPAGAAAAPQAAPWAP